MGDKKGILESPGLKIAHLNVASILGAHKFEMLKKQVEGSKLDIFCASESWLTSNIPDGLIGVQGYNLARVDRCWREEGKTGSVKKGGGLICYTAQSINMNEFRYAHLNQSSKNLEMQWISLDMPNVRRMVIINI